MVVRMTDFLLGQDRVEQDDRRIVLFEPSTRRSCSLMSTVLTGREKM